MAKAYCRMKDTYIETAPINIWVDDRPGFFYPSPPQYTIDMSVIVVPDENDQKSSIAQSVVQSVADMFNLNITFMPNEITGNEPMLSETNRDRVRS